jgi:hypothetical protein
MYVIMDRDRGGTYGGIYINGKINFSIFVSTFVELARAKCWATLCEDYDHLYSAAASVWHIPGTEWGG